LSCRRCRSAGVHRSASQWTCHAWLERLFLRQRAAQWPHLPMAIPAQRHLNWVNVADNELCRSHQFCFDIGPTTVSMNGNLPMCPVMPMQCHQPPAILFVNPSSFISIATLAGLPESVAPPTVEHNALFNEPHGSRGQPYQYFVAICIITSFAWCALQQRWSSSTIGGRLAFTAARMVSAPAPNSMPYGVAVDGNGTCCSGHGQ